MDNTQNFSASNASGHLEIKLLDGRTLSCLLKPEQPKEIKPSEIALDTTGQYLSFGKKGKKITPTLEARIQRRYDNALFTENAWFLLEHAEEIFSDSRMFLAPVDIHNGLAYIGRNGFQDSTLGVYLEWWLHYSDASIDANGSLIWFISGSPLSGCNCCSSVALDGKMVDSELRTRFSEVWRSFIHTNTRYNEVKQRCEAYSLEDVLIKLKGEEYISRIVELRHEIIKEVTGS